MTADIHPTIQKLADASEAGDMDALPALMAEDVRFSPPTYRKTWTGPARTCAMLRHFSTLSRDYRYRRIMGGGSDWALEFECTVGGLQAQGADLITLNDAGLIRTFDVLMRPFETIEVLRDAINRRVMSDASFAQIMSQSS